tara:strand:- start:47 stop:496 length:450 start_codon:yes stop_codon:yes gene_type:complete
MAIEFAGSEQWISKRDLQAGQLISFGYSRPIATVGDDVVMGSSIRWGIIIAPVWKENCDCYVFDSKEDVPEELLEWADQEPAVGVAYDTFGNQYTFKSFKTSNMSDIQNIEFDTYREGEEVEEGQEVSDGEMDGFEALLRELGLLETED